MDQERTYITLFDIEQIEILKLEDSDSKRVRLKIGNVIMTVHPASEDWPEIKIEQRPPPVAQTIDEAITAIEEAITPQPPEQKN